MHEQIYNPIELNKQGVIEILAMSVEPFTKGAPNIQQSGLHIRLENSDKCFNEMNANIQKM